MSISVIEFDVGRPSLEEVLAFMRAGKVPDKEIFDAAERATALVCGAVRARACFVKLPLKLLGGGKMSLGKLEFESKSLENRLSVCSFAYVFAVTVGADVDRIIRAESARSSLSGLCADAVGSAAVEHACDILNEQINAICESEGYGTKTRFSAGYGDLSIEYQKDIAHILDTKKNIGAALGAGGMMTPTKTVTAIIGVYRTDENN